MASPTTPHSAPRPARPRMAIGSPRHYRWLEGIVGVTIVLNVVDAILTLIWIFMGFAEEANPLMALLLDVHPVLFVLGKLTLVGLGTIVLWRLRRRAAAVVAIFAVFLTYYAIILYHLKAMNVHLVQRLLE